MARYDAYIGLIRAIGSETHKKMSMRQLCEGCISTGLEQVSTHISSQSSSAIGEEALRNPRPDVVRDRLATYS
jgi:Protein of unknown function (DUF1697)